MSEHDNDQYIEQFILDSRVRAWFAVTEVLKAVAPGWAHRPGTGIECATETIRELAADAKRFRSYATIRHTESNVLLNLELRYLNGESPTLDDWRSAVDELIAAHEKGGIGV